jgi:nucleotide-binding universal stress UspA family protein
MRFRRILCAVDFSEESVKAFDTAVELARQSGGTLFVLHVTEAQPVVSQWMPVEGLGQVAVSLEAKANQAMDALLASSDLEDLSVTTKVATGRAFVEILEHVKSWEADLVVLGAHGAASLEPIIFGSTAERVLKASPCSVLVVREPRPEQV